MNKFTQEDLNLIKNEFGTISFLKLLNECNKIKNGILVDIGVCKGSSSKVMLYNSVKNRNKIYAIDTILNYNNNIDNYMFIKEDSVTVGESWKLGHVDFVFFDSVHAKEQILCELYHWWDIIKEGGIACFHDTSWHGYIHKDGHEAAGKLTGNTQLGYDKYGDINWETADKAVEQFFNIKINTEQRDINDDKFIVIYEDDYILVETNYANLGMTFVKKKKYFDYKNNISEWSKIFDKRKILLSFFK